MSLKKMKRCGRWQISWNWQRSFKLEYEVKEKEAMAKGIAEGIKNT